MASDTQDEAFTVGALETIRAVVSNATSRNGTTAESSSTEASKINIVSEYCKAFECKDYETPEVVILFNKILWANWAISASVTLFGIVVMYRKWIKVSIIQSL